MKVAGPTQKSAPIRGREEDRTSVSQNPFQEAVLEKKEFVYTLELVPGRGARGKTQDQILGLAEKAIQGKLVHALSITDNPGGHPALSPDVIGLGICRLGINPIFRTRQPSSGLRPL